MNKTELDEITKAFTDEGFETNIANFGNRSYPLCYGKNAISQLKTFFEQTQIKSNILIVTEQKVKDLFEEKVNTALQSHQGNISWVTISGLEKNKTIETVSDLYQHSADLHIDKSSVVIALGGGVIQDITNYFAATFHRGIKLIQIPTTVLSQADIGFGGCAVNHKAGKSLIGQFYQPVLCLFDETVLYTLPATEISSGLSEIINKVLCLGGFARDEILNDFKQIREGDFTKLMHYIKLSNEVKLNIIERDEDGQVGTRLLLDWGHTITHALERVMKYNITHGFALGIGMMCATKMSESKSGFPAYERRFLEELITVAGLPTALPATVTHKEILQCVTFDQKKLHNQTRFILMREFGDCFMSEVVSEYEVKETL